MDTLAVNLVLRGRRALVCGTKDHAKRRVAYLLEAGANVDWWIPVAAASPEPPVVASRAGEEPGTVRIMHVAYPFSPDAPAPSMAAYRTVFAYHVEPEANRRLLQDAQAQGVLACSLTDVDQSDFLNPAVFEWDKSQVAISTGGTACRRAKYQTRRLKRLVELDDRRVLTVIGLDHRMLSLEELAAVYPSPEHQDLIRRRLGVMSGGVGEFALLCTCNRVELYATLSDDPDLVEWVIEVMGFSRVRGAVYVLQDGEAVLHAANLVAGHHSAVPGETQITSQFKKCLWQALEDGEAGATLQKLLDTVLATAKRVRQEQPAIIAHQSIPAVVASWVDEDCASHPHRIARVLILGAGEIGITAYNELARVRKQGRAVEITWANRTVAKLPTHGDFIRMSLDEAVGRLAHYDYIVCAVRTQEPMVRPDHFRVMNGCSPIVFDLGMPPNAADGLREHPRVQLVRLEGLKKRQSERFHDRDALFALTEKHLGDLSETVARIKR